MDDLEEAIAAAVDSGGSVVTPPSPVPGYGRYAAVLDTEGNEFGLVRGRRRRRLTRQGAPDR